MKGLILKDIMCLRKQLTIFCYVIIGVLIVSVMFVLSTRFGNLASGAREMLAENSMTEFEINNLATLALVLFMFLPLAVVGDVLNVFEEDSKAGFAKVGGALPVSLPGRMLSRYFSVFALLSIGAAFDLLIAVILSFLTDIVSLPEFIGMIVSAASVIGIYSSLVILYRIMNPGAGKGQNAQILSLLTMAVGFILIRFQKVKEIVTIIANEQVENNDMSAERMWDLLTVVKDRAWIIFLIALAVTGISFALSLSIAERKRGVI